ncbi:hypothetical protein J6TS1_48860 [Siminovitchia terrae]|uniref:Uncharacterized protein n=1 Tax=Siminovitchia terrae TaxID=1914933 RepID=A0ABQ4L417_SIMTE|nr:hypothetical protein J6TS1_48860 [Siminovitchia terrae]
MNGENWISPLCDYNPPIDFRWPEYVTTPRGDKEWVIPSTDQEVEYPKTTNYGMKIFVNS